MSYYIVAFRRGYSLASHRYEGYTIKEAMRLFKEKYGLKYQRGIKIYIYQ